MTSRVRTHTRRNKNGGTSRVRQHSTAGRPRKALVSPRHSWKLIRKAFGHGRRGRRGLAAGLAVLAVAELAAWLTLAGTSLLLVTAGALAVGVGALCASAGGLRP